MSRKEELLQIIADSIEELKSLHGDDGASMFIHGDMEEEECRVQMAGDPIVLDTTFESHMVNNPQFNQIMFAMFVAYLANYPDQKEAFLEGLNLSDFNINLN